MTLLIDRAAPAVPIAWLASQPRGWQVVHHAADRHIPRVVRTARRAILEAQGAVDEDRVAEAIASGLLPQVEATVLPAVALIGRRLDEVAADLLLAVAVDAAMELARLANRSDSFRSAQLGITFDRRNPAAVAWARTRAGTMIADITTENLASVREIMQRAIVEGIPPRRAARLLPRTIGLTRRQANAVLNLEQRLRSSPGRLVRAGDLAFRVPRGGLTDALIARRTQQYADRLLRQRLLNIARTETIAAANAGQRALWDQAVADGLLSPAEQREWIVTFDDRLCQICEPMAGQVRGLDEPFDSSVGPLDGPPAHPACRCAQGITDAR